MSFVLAIILDRIAVTRVVLNTRLHSCPFVVSSLYPEMTCGFWSGRTCLAGEGCSFEWWESARPLTIPQKEEAGLLRPLRGEVR